MNKPVDNASSELREFMLCLRQALLLVVGYIERKYGMVRSDKK
jgi:hypothetical protein